MINILVRDYYKFYQQGIEALLSFLFLSEYRESVDFYYDLTPSNITRADIIVIDLCAGEQLTCLSELKTAGHALIIGIVDSEFSSRTLLPGCLSHSVIIARSESLAFCFAKIKFAISKKMSFPELPVLKHCTACRVKTFSFQQRQVMEGFYRGENFHQLANKLNVKHSTVFAHKYQVMDKLCLKNDYELYFLLKRLHQKNFFLPGTEPQSVGESSLLNDGDNQ